MNKNLKYYANHENFLFWVAQGYKFGYPKCCILKFCKTIDDGLVLPPSYNIKSNYSGFIPCPKCSKSILYKKNRIKELIKSYRMKEIGIFKLK